MMVSSFSQALTLYAAATAGRPSVSMTDVATPAGHGKSSLAEANPLWHQTGSGRTRSNLMKALPKRGVTIDVDMSKHGDGNVTMGRINPVPVYLSHDSVGEMQELADFLDWAIKSPVFEKASLEYGDNGPLTGGEVREAVMVPGMIRANNSTKQDELIFADSLGRALKALLENGTLPSPRDGENENMYFVVTPPNVRLVANDTIDPNSVRLSCGMHSAVTLNNTHTGGAIDVPYAVVPFESVCDLLKEGDGLNATWSMLFGAATAPHPENGRGVYDSDTVVNGRYLDIGNACKDKFINVTSKGESKIVQAIYFESEKACGPTEMLTGEHGIQEGPGSQGNMNPGLSTENRILIALGALTGTAAAVVIAICRRRLASGPALAAFSRAAPADAAVPAGERILNWMRETTAAELELDEVDSRGARLAAVGPRSESGRQTGEDGQQGPSSANG